MSETRYEYGIKSVSTSPRQRLTATCRPCPDEQRKSQDNEDVSLKGTDFVDILSDHFVTQTERK